MFCIAGCAGNQQGYQQAFDSQHSLTQNQSVFSQPPANLFNLSKQTFIQQGFTVESADIKSGIIKAVRNMADKDNSDISYNINVSTDISETAEAGTNVSLAASQQTILHRSTTTWWHLLWILPIIPTGTEYQTLVIKEGNITDPGFYTDYFNSLKVAATKFDLAVKVAAAKASEKAAAEKLAAEKAAQLKAEATAAAEKVEAERVAAEKIAKLQADAEAKVNAEKAEAAKLAPGKDTKLNVEPAAKADSEIADSNNPKIVEKSTAEKKANQ
jgi:uncharacterized cupredoxin-like copper-binding protein